MSLPENLGMNVENRSNDVFTSIDIETIDGGGYLEKETSHTENGSGHNEVLESDVRNFDEIQDENNHGILQDENKEVLGVIFDTTDEAYIFYNRYALLHGFGVRIHCDHKNRATNEVYRKLYVCNKQGFKRVSGDSSNGSAKKLRRATRTGCEAMFRIAKRQDGKREHVHIARD